VAFACRTARELLDPRNLDVVVAVTTWEKLVSTEASGTAAKMIALEWPWTSSARSGRCWRHESPACTTSSSTSTVTTIPACIAALTPVPGRSFTIAPRCDRHCQRCNLPPPAFVARVFPTCQVPLQQDRARFNASQIVVRPRSKAIPSQKNSARRVFFARARNYRTRGPDNLPLMEKIRPAQSDHLRNERRPSDEWLSPQYDSAISPERTATCRCMTCCCC